eukprot:TRINITY_DN617_c0_g1_i7.p2 TRINITY_DN617_c0_g1~~TRINITY_DN617_c0_g1_i7.p2  ORF type:complete len:109 (+),score=22.29 TRINITY_DN617_c0_g1_i7:77-403(+)
MCIRDRRRTCLSSSRENISKDLRYNHEQKLVFKKTSKKTAWGKCIQTSHFFEITHNYTEKETLLELYLLYTCLLYTSDAADDLLCVDLGGRRIIKKKKCVQIVIEQYD